MKKRPIIQPRAVGRNMMAENTYKVGDKIKFAGEKQRYTVKAVSERFVIATKPFNPLKTVIYTILDFGRGLRGPNNLTLNPWDYNIQSEIDECMLALTEKHHTGLTCGISLRKAAVIEIEK